MGVAPLGDSGDDGVKRATSPAQSPRPMATAEVFTATNDQIAALIEAIQEQKALVEQETSVLKARQEMLLALMDRAGLDRARTDAGSVTVCAGKRTVSVTDPALKAEIKLIQERGVRTGRCEERIGARYLMIRR